MQKNYGRKLSSLSEFYRILYLWLRTGKYLFRAQKSGILSTRFIERIMLAVTEVNQCPLCSYAHTKMALEAGMSSAEIKSLLTHHLDSVPDDETTAVLFAQHYADSRSNPSPKAWKRVVDTYGEEKARAILGAVRTITFGNTVGIVLNSVKGRLRGKPDPRSSVRYELSMLAASIPLFFAALIHAAVSDLFRRPIL